MANEPLPLPTPRYRCPMQSDEVPPLMGGPDQLESRSSEHPYSADLIGPCVSTSLVSYAPPVRYNGNTGYDDAFRTATDLAEHQRNEGHGHRGTYLTPGVTQRSPVVPGPPTRPDYQTLVAPEVSDDDPRSRGPIPYHAARPTQGLGNPSSLRPGIAATNDLKHLASQYLHSPGSQVETLRMKRSRSGGFKVLILLDIDDSK